MELRIVIECDNAAFDNAALGEVGRILRDLASRLYGVRTGSGKLQDINGNTVGSFEMGETPDENS